MANEKRQRYEVYRRSGTGRLYIRDTQTGMDVGGRQVYMGETNALTDLLNSQTAQIERLTAALENIYDKALLASIMSNPMVYVEAMGPIREVAEKALAEAEGKGEGE